jgi:iron complex transport system substrate-binding protein
LVTPLALIVLVLVSACGDGGDQGKTAGAGDVFPMTIENCGQRIAIAAPPKRVLLIGNHPLSLLPTSAFDRVVAVAGDPAVELYDEDLRQRVEKIPTIGSGTLDGGTEVTLEQVLAESPDLVIGLPYQGAVTREALAGAGIPVIELPAFCADKSQALTNADFEDVYTQVELYGRLFGAEDEAGRTVAELRRRVGAVQDTARDLSARTAAVLFVTPGSPVVYAYAGSSMFDRQLDTLGLTNLFGDVNQRVFEVNLEEVIGKDPDVVILAHSSSEPERIKKEFLDIRGIDRVRAVRHDEILVMRWEYAEPPTPLSVQGLETIAKKFAGAR